MALKPSIYKAVIELSNLDSHYYDQLNLTLALHPSETHERMMVRLLSFCLHAQQGVSFTKGLSATDEPDLWAHSLDGRIIHWIQVGQPDPDVLRKAHGRAESVSVYAFGRSAPVWWLKNHSQLESYAGVQVVQLPWPQIVELAKFADKKMELSVMVQEGICYVSNAENAVEIELQWLKKLSEQ